MSITVSLEICYDPVRCLRNHIDENQCTRDEFNEMIPVQYSEYQISKKGELVTGKLTLFSLSSTIFINFVR